MFKKFQMDTLLPSIAERCFFNFAIQGELCGPGIQNNIYGLQEQKLFIYNIINLSTGQPLHPFQRWKFCNKYMPQGIEHAPLVQFIAGFEDGEPRSLDALLDLADGNSALAPVQREGLVFKAFDGESFKVISNKYLESGGCHGNKA
jgi:ATP-dependent RNA circularization protein (DNA/RNA ligase family)